ncbi:hypothetical protein QJS04_geneDACA014926 [Acorus gramineus]|uniref:Uncharacterized protein n=1 Tax=Acorus gramineus TaxID=55184 RepID=A0AAV9BWB3_ACOGR|nr:hypothetical protein QJS04_geneDACA014926 [Acorus gramineus]
MLDTGLTMGALTDLSNSKTSIRVVVKDKKKPAHTGPSPRDLHPPCARMRARPSVARNPARLVCRRDVRAQTPS